MNPTSTARPPMKALTRRRAGHVSVQLFRVPRLNSSAQMGGTGGCSEASWLSDSTSSRLHPNGLQISVSRAELSHGFNGFWNLTLGRGRRPSSARSMATRPAIASMQQARMQFRCGAQQPCAARSSSDRSCSRLRSELMRHANRSCASLRVRGTQPSHVLALVQREITLSLEA